MRSTRTRQGLAAPGPHVKLNSHTPGAGKAWPSCHSIDHNAAQDDDGDNGDDDDDDDGDDEADDSYAGALMLRPTCQKRRQRQPSAIGAAARNEAARSGRDVGRGWRAEWAKSPKSRGVDGLSEGRGAGRAWRAEPPLYTGSAALKCPERAQIKSLSCLVYE